MKPIFKQKFSVPTSSPRLSPILSQSKENGTSRAKTCDKSSNKENGLSQNNTDDATSKIEQSLSDEQYDEIFSTVLRKAAEGKLFDEKNPECLSPHRAAEQYKQFVQKLSPKSTQVKNEITPNTSPQEDDHDPPKLLLQKPAKKIPSKQSTELKSHKRKTLDYAKTKGKGKENQTHRRHKTDSEIVRHKKKVLSKGIWVQCCDRNCLKWRYLHNCCDPSTLPEVWTCSMNKDDVEQNTCSAPEIDWTAALKCSQDHFVYTKFNAGSIVWAKMPGYPSWPAMIDSDPDMNLFYEYNDDGTVVDSKGRDFKAELQSAMLNADAALKMTLEQRLGKFSFEKRFISNKIGMKEWFAERSSRKAKSHGSSKRIKTNISARVTPHSDVESKGKNSTIATGNRLCHEGGSLAERAEIVKEKTANKENSNVKPDKTSQETIHKRSPKTARMSSPSTKLAVSILKKLETSNQKRVDFATKVILENVHETELIDVTNVVKNKDAGDCCITNIKETNLSSQDFNDPLKGDLKSSTAEESPGRAIQNLTKHKLDIDECFWDPCPDDFQDSPSVFCNLDEPSMAMNDSDEERMRQLDELMPVLVQQD
ncbi:uncharacterized protein LOC143464850 isoform X2 [Clavelina lepadiformis]|uniref:uncharacterized protein LOC143464850 isoform X2 n=1 Tax=Clavelina lepadiformis TaxID=159417 RepID=UPI0040413D26